MNNQFSPTHQPLKIDIYSTMGSIEAAIIFAKSQESPNWSQIARDYEVGQLQLWRRATGVCQSVEDYHKSRELLSPAQTRFLIDYFKKLSDLGLPPTPTMV